MTVAELIEKLKEMPPDLPVVVFGHDTGTYGADRIEINKDHRWREGGFVGGHDVEGRCVFIR